MKQLVIEESKAKELYKTASTEFKSVLEDTFGKKFFKTSIIDRIKNLIDVCDEVEEDYSKFMESIRGLPKDEQAYRKLKLIVKAFNESWIPDWSNSSEYKYFPYFNMNKKPGSGFFGSGTCSWDGCSVTSARLALKSSVLAECAGKIFENEYYDYMVIE